MEGNPTRVRIRIANTFLLPVRSTLRTMLKARDQGLFEGASVLLMQEMWSARAQRGVACVVADTACGDDSADAAPVASTVGILGTKLLHSGLVAVGLDGWDIALLAFEPYTACEGFDAFANKGIGLFTCTHRGSGWSLVAGNTHLQCSWVQNGKGSSARVRARQLAQAVQFAAQHGAAFLGGDINVGSQAELNALDDIVAENTQGRGVRVPLPPGAVTHYTKRAFDQGWILRPEVFRPEASTATVEPKVTLGWSDHAAVLFDLAVA
jgi:hypothetical protein